MRVSPGARPRAYLLLVLHAHLPYARHPERAEMLEERWLFEAITECYLELLSRLERLTDDGIPYRLTLSLSPTLLALWRDPLLQGRYLRHLEGLIDLAERELWRTRKDVGRQPLARFYRDLFTRARSLYVEHYRQDLAGAFRALAQAGGLELITTAATHGYLPLLRGEPTAVAAQVRVGRASFRDGLGQDAPGFWLPECGYYPGLEWVLQESGFGYFFLDSHGLGQARPPLPAGLPLACPNGVVAFARDPGCSREVWSHAEGYPGHPLYREFHRDIGHELAPQALGALADPAGGRAPTGIRYHRVTDRATDRKALYDPAAAAAQAEGDAQAFLSRRLEAAAGQPPGGSPPLFVAPYDAELFGHWWLEGPHWLEWVIRQAPRRGLELVSASDYLQRHPPRHQGQPAPSSWGEGGYHGFWLGPANAWIYPPLHQAARDMHALALAYPRAPGGVTERALRQAGRSLLLAQASDWPFMMRTGSGVDYAAAQVRDHLARFAFLRQSLLEGRPDLERLQALEEMDKLFANLDYRAFA